MKPHKLGRARSARRTGATGLASMVRAAPFGSLTTREREVHERLIRGDCNKEIAHQLECTPRTVAFHVSNILRKTGKPSRTRLIAASLPEPVEPQRTVSEPGSSRRNYSMSFGEICVDLLTHQLFLGQERVQLSRSQLSLLLKLLELPGVPVPCTELCTAASATSCGAVHKQMTRLRARLERCGRKLEVVSHPHGRAYVLR